ncbi:hypothetical protein RvY_17102-3 [Ramazzottius varieornatus]|uniref:Uncharacterized protein n=1 Tax=Ramazzottius varieornatus TaxID=947166 RepID=A0A1D1W840_RAMVA|nr:hypothetical protein RvY_17102-3 [Ramazzottius varieornatus]
MSSSVGVVGSWPSVNMMIGGARRAGVSIKSSQQLASSRLIAWPHLLPSPPRHLPVKSTRSSASSSSSAASQARMLPQKTSCLSVAGLCQAALASRRQRAFRCRRRCVMTIVNHILGPTLTIEYQGAILVKSLSLQRILRIKVTH